MLWGAGDRAAALASLSASPRRQAAFALAVDQPAAAAAALARIPDTDPAHQLLAARLAWREGRLTDAARAPWTAPAAARPAACAPPSPPSKPTSPRLPPPTP